MLQRTFRVVESVLFVWGLFWWVDRRSTLVRSVDRSVANAALSAQRPYQCLFMAACAHVWHYKCIRRLLNTPDYPMFQCPNCRAWTDLSAEVDDSDDEQRSTRRELPSGTPQNNPENEETRESHPLQENGASQGQSSDDADLAAITENMRLEAENPDAGTTQDEPTASNGRSANIPIPTRLSPTGTLSGASRHGQSQRRSDTPGSTETFEDNPMTPRNDNGPLAFDGRAGRL